MTLYSRTVHNMERVNEISNQYLKNLVGVHQPDWADYVFEQNLIAM
jgi:hypothetical protein